MGEIETSRLWRTAVVAAAAAGVLGVAALASSAGLGGTPDRVAGSTAGTEPQTVTRPVSEFGDGMREATLARFPQARPAGEELADHEVWVRDGRIVEPALHDPVVWDSLHWWDQYYRLPGEVRLTVTAQRTAPGSPTAGMLTSCDAFSYPSQKSCDYAAVGDLRVVVVDGIRFDDPDFWHREVIVVGGSVERGMPMHTTAHASVDGVASWSEAQRLLPDAGAMSDLALDPATHLPEPRFFDGADS